MAIELRATEGILIGDFLYPLTNFTRVRSLRVEDKVEDAIGIASRNIRRGEVIRYNPLEATQDIFLNEDFRLLKKEMQEGGYYVMKKGGDNMVTITFEFDLEEKVKTKFGDVGFIEMLGFSATGRLYFVKISMKLEGEWFRADELTKVEKE